MYISNKDLEVLQEIELYLYNIKDIHSMGLYLKLYSLNEKLLQKRDKTNKANWNRISIKRQKNKMYARSKKEIEKMCKNEKSR